MAGKAVENKNLGACVNRHLCNCFPVQLRVNGQQQVPNLSHLIYVFIQGTKQELNVRAFLFNLVHRCNGADIRIIKYHYLYIRVHGNI